MTVHRMNICIEVPAIPKELGGGADAKFEKASLVSFDDMIRFIGGLVAQTKHDAEGRIANAVYQVSTEWNVQPELANIVPEMPER